MYSEYSEFKDEFRTSSNKFIIATTAHFGSFKDSFSIGYYQFLFALSNKSANLRFVIVKNYAKFSYCELAK